jgi:hypothetical protein
MSKNKASSSKTTGSSSKKQRTSSKSGGSSSIATVVEDTEIPPNVAAQFNWDANSPVEAIAPLLDAVVAGDAAVQLIFGESAHNLIRLPRAVIAMVLDLGNGHLTAESFFILTKLLDLVPTDGDVGSHAVAAAARASKSDILDLKMVHDFVPLWPRNLLIYVGPPAKGTAVEYADLLAKYTITDKTKLTALLTKVSGKLPRKTNRPGALQAAGTGPGGSSAADDHAALVRSSLKRDKSRFGRMLDKFTSEMEHAISVSRQVFDAQSSLTKLTREHKCLLEQEEFVRGEIARLRTTINRSSVSCEVAKRNIRNHRLAIFHARDQFLAVMPPVYAPVNTGSLGHPLTIDV